MTLDQIIQDAHSSMSYGTVSLTVKKHEGNITTVDTTKITSNQVTGNAQALTVIGSMLKLMHEAEESGNLTFTVTLDKGDAKRLMTQDFKRVNF
jgi:ArsR family metal-binding transcriptional regulator